MVDGFDGDHLTIDRACEELNLSTDWLRDVALKVALAADPTMASVKDYARTIRATVDGLKWPTHVKRSPSTSYLRTPNAYQWSMLGSYPQTGRHPGLPCTP
jgi:hypothetical protein